MTFSRKPLEILVYQDVLCAWCYVAERRLDVLKEEFGRVLQWRTRPYPLCIPDATPTKRQTEGWIREMRRASREPEGGLLSPLLWTSEDPPRTSVTALAAIEAARLQGPDARTALARAMQRAALELGVNVSRPDVAYELAGQLGLNMNRFAAAFQSPESTRLILEEHRLARKRGVKGVPTVVVGGRWMICGLREVDEYRTLILDCMNKRGMLGGSHDSPLH